MRKRNIQDDLLPNHLPVEETHIYPESSLSNMICIVKEITDILDNVPAYFKINRLIRYKYVSKDKDKTQISIRYFYS